MVDWGNLTFTGLDAHTELESLAHGPEYGVLYSANPGGRARYPDHCEVRRILSKCHNLGHRTALHICGRTAKYCLVSGILDYLVGMVRRVQINGPVSQSELLEVCQRYYDRVIITQYNEQGLAANTDLISLNLTNHSILLDASGGTGKVATSWPELDTRKPVGYAGGLDADKIVGVIKDLGGVATERSWFDMETGVRDADDRFDLKKVKGVLTACGSF